MWRYEDKKIAEKNILDSSEEHFILEGELYNKDKDNGFLSRRKQKKLLGLKNFEVQR